MKDWHLLLLSVGIVLIDVVYTIPLLVLVYVIGDATLEIDYEKLSFINVSELISIYMICPKSLFENMCML